MRNLIVMFVTAVYFLFLEIKNACLVVSAKVAHFIFATPSNIFPSAVVHICPQIKQLFWKQ